MSPKICFCIPFYKNLDLLRGCVESVKRQTSSQYKIIISQDFGGDQIPDNFFDSSVVVVKSDIRLGLVGNFNKCLELSEGPLTTLLHADDTLEPGYTEAMLSLYSQHPDADAYICRTHIINIRDKLVFSLPDFVKELIHPFKYSVGVITGDRHLSRIIFGNYIFCPTLCFTKKEKFSTLWHQVTDLELTTRILLRGGKIVSHPKKLFNYRRHKNSLTTINTQVGERFKEESLFFNSLFSNISKKDWPKTHLAARLRVTHRLNLFLSFAQDLVFFRFKNAALKIKLFI